MGGRADLLTVGSLSLSGSLSWDPGQGGGEMGLFKYQKHARTHKQTTPVGRPCRRTVWFGSG